MGLGSGLHMRLVLPSAATCPNCSRALPLPPNPQRQGGPDAPGAPAHDPLDEQARMQLMQEQEQQALQVFRSVHSAATYGPGQQLSWAVLCQLLHSLLPLLPMQVAQGWGQAAFMGSMPVHGSC